jgi:hypothetical protein
MPAPFGTLSSTQEFGASGGATILNGTTAPTDTTGAVGDFYIDTVGKNMYGPKIAGSIGPDMYAINPAAGPPQYPSSGPGDYTLGFRVAFLVPGVVSALRFYRSPTATVTSRTLTLYRLGVSMATVTTSGESGSGWKQYPLTAPVPVETGVLYVSAYYTVGDFFAETDTGGTPPSFSPAQIQNYGGCYRSGAGFPNNDVTFNYWADLVFNEGAAPWPMALKSA